MNRETTRHTSDTDSEAILETLSTHQYLRPHQPVSIALGAASESVGFCPGAAEQAIQWLGIPPGTPIGRLRRTELTQLARSIERFWRRARQEVSQ
jgi:hypothetical protein